jgi:streptogramin lyase
MSSYRDALERAGARFRLPPDALERLHRRREQRQRNRRVASGALALLIAAGGTWVAVGALRGIRPQPRPSGPVTVARLPVFPNAIAVGEGGAWITSAEDGQLIRLEPASGEIAARIPLPPSVGTPVDVQVAMGSVWVQTGPVGAGIDPSVLRIDPGTNQIVGTITLEPAEHGPVAFGAGSVWSVDAHERVVSQRDPEDGRVMDTISPEELARGRLGEQIRDLGAPVALRFGQGALWVLLEGRAGAGHPDSGPLVRIDPRRVSVTGTAKVGDNLAVDVGAGGVWLVNAQDAAVLRVDPGTLAVVDVIDLPDIASAITSGPAGVWVLDQASGTVSRIDPVDGRINRVVRVGSDPVVLGQGEGSVWVARSDGSILRV